MNTYDCADCGFPVKTMSDKAIAKGSSVRDPGEVVCIGCTASRSKLVRELQALPSSLREIISKRMVRS